MAARPRRQSLSNLWIQQTILILVLSFLYVPIIVLIIFSFNTSYLSALWTGFTFEWYRVLLQEPTLLHSLVISVEVGIIQTVISTILGTLGGIALHRYNFWGKKALIYFLYVPIVIPEIVMAVSLLIYLPHIGVPLGVPAMVIGHTTFTIPYVVLVVRASMAGFDTTLEEAARDLGASELQTLWRVTVPVILPGIIVGALLSFSQSFDDFTTSFFLDGSGNTPLPVQIYGMLRHGVNPSVNALSTVIVLATLAIVFVGQREQRKRAQTL
ncbi:MAG: spermidine/putrescine ABC transporter permease PotC [Sulfobacillus benefaciens]|uniref:Spermidine/putrescine ABC transporter permease PotC n=1 Tax=Sulfobacillus benefaciens TaxID=453960 RepID=A0A2T2XKT8_9FIRM|nr:MAG: spermidine/putrescine ABC transporter permease PotC [Sulfobacillus benefaciens]